MAQKCAKHKTRILISIDRVFLKRLDDLAMLEHISRNLLIVSILESHVDGTKPVYSASREAFIDEIVKSVLTRLDNRAEK